VTPTLFDPQQIRTAAKSLPKLQGEVERWISEATLSKAYSRLLKSRRQIVRVLANLQFDHLVTLSEAIECCLAADFQPRGIFSTARANFSGSISEVFVADALIKRGIRIENGDKLPPGAKGGTPELHFRIRNDDVFIEIYAPRLGGEFALFIDDLSHALKNLDTAFDFLCEIAVETLEMLQNGYAAFLQPETAYKAIKSTQDNTIDSIASEVERGVFGKQAFQVERQFPAGNLKIVLRVPECAQSQRGSPERELRSAYSFSGMCPESQFSDVLRLVRNKAKKGQAVGRGGTSLLFVDLSHTDLASECKRRPYRNHFQKLLEKIEHRAEYDSVIFFDSRGGKLTFLPLISGTRGRLVLEELGITIGDRS
jgi:hypothetical protein